MKEYKSAIRASKINVNDNLITNSNTPIKTMWNIINDKRHSQSKHITCPFEPDAVNYFFVNNANVLQQQLGVPIHNTNKQGSLANNKSFSFHKISYNAVREAIDTLKSSNVRDCYGLTARIIKATKNILIPPLTKLINDSIEKSIFPDLLKQAVVIPIFKKGDSKDLNNYRPISLLPILSKVYEKVLSKQMSLYFESNELFFKHQYGFRKNKSTVDAILNLVDSIIDSFENKDSHMSIFCDLTKAFDCVPHQELLNKLCMYNFDEGAVTLIKSYLEDRSQKVLVGDVASKSLRVEFGVPQGSILGPLLFLVFINDLPRTNNDRDASYLLYADDTMISVHDKNMTNLIARSSDAQETAGRWFRDNRLTLNIEKTVRVIFSLCRHTFDDEESTEAGARFLGVHFDRTLSWKVHVDQVASKVSRNVYVLRNLTDSLSSGILRTAYFALCHSLISYAILAWGQASSWKRIFALQRRAVRLISGLNYRADCRDQFVKLKILTFPSIYIYESLIFARTNVDALSMTRVDHGYSTRRRDDFRLPQLRLSKSQRTVNFLSIKYFNKLPEWIRVLSVGEFKKKVKSILLSNPFYDYAEFMNFEF